MAKPKPSKLPSTNRQARKSDAALWGGRFKEGSAPAFARLNNSFTFDYRLLPFDVQGSAAYARALFRAGILRRSETHRILRALKQIREEYAQYPGRLTRALLEYEDVHAFVEAELVKRVGDSGKKIHTGRSRNDQVALDFRLYLRHELMALQKSLWMLMAALVRRAERQYGDVLPGYTHLQRAQPVLLSHFWLAYFQMLKRDRARFLRVKQAVNVMPLGAGALAGSGFPVDRRFLAKALDFPAITENSLDAVSDRDFALEFLSAGSILMVHLSRLAEDLILYSTSEFGFVELSDTVSSGSSLMPQKKNPDALELVRGKTGRVLGNLQRLLVTLKALPLAYNKDMQEDKEAVFDTLETLQLCLPAMIEVIQTLKTNPARMRQAAETGHLNATDCADYLVRKGVPFRTAHEVVGKLVLHAIKRSVPLEGLTLNEFRSFSLQFQADIFKALRLQETLKRRSAHGGTAPLEVKKAIHDAKRYLTFNR